jgi:hypothetical protein
MNKQSPNDFLHIGNPSFSSEEKPQEKDFGRIEERIQMVEEMMESWKEALISPEKALDKEFIKRAFNELAMLTELVDSLYAEWIQLDEISGSTCSEKTQNKLIC